MKLYKNISELWGDTTIVSYDDYKLQAIVFNVDELLLQEKSDGVYFDGEKIGELVNER
jgi:hypothetical protein